MPSFHRRFGNMQISRASPTHKYTVNNLTSFKYPLATSKIIFCDIISLKKKNWAVVLWLCASWERELEVSKCKAVIYVCYIMNYLCYVSHNVGVGFLRPPPSRDPTSTTSSGTSRLTVTSDTSALATALQTALNGRTAPTRSQSQPVDLAVPTNAGPQSHQQPYGWHSQPAAFRRGEFRTGWELRIFIICPWSFRRIDHRYCTKLRGSKTIAVSKFSTTVEPFFLMIMCGNFFKRLKKCDKKKTSLMQRALINEGCSKLEWARYCCSFVPQR